MPISEYLIYRGKYTIRTSEIDRNKTVTVASFINIMQEAAMQNVIEIKLSIWDLASQGISWVLLRKNLIIHRLPKLNETITVETHPAGFERLFTYRDYKVYDSANNLIAQSSSTWLLMDTETRHAAKIPESITNLETFDPSEFLKRPKSKLPKITQTDIGKIFEVNWHDLDFNDHLGNVRYMQWMFETVDYYTKHTGRLKEFNIIYKLEGHWGDQINVETQQISENEYLHKLIRTTDEQELASAQSFWEIL